MSSKAEILRRIRVANGSSSTEESARSGWNALSRNYRRAGVQRRTAMLELLEDRLRDYDAMVGRSDRQHLAQCVAQRLEECRKHRMVVPAGVPPEWLPERFEFVVDEMVTPAELDTSTGC